MNEKIEKEEEFELEEVDLETWSKTRPGERPPRCKRYRIRVDKKHFVVSDSALKGREILALVGYQPNEWLLAQKFPGGRREQIEPDQLVDLREPGIERFETTPKQAQAGSSSSPRRAFSLPAEDIEFLDSKSEEWEAVVEGQSRGILLPNFPLPPGLAPSHADLLVRVPQQYPVAQLDMYSLAPNVSRVDGKPIPKITQETFDGRTWQRWSRHRRPGQEWRVGIDGLATHLVFTQSALEAEGNGGEQ